MPVLSELFGECPQVKILEMFAEDNKGMLYIADIIRVTKLSKMTVNSYIHKLLEEGIIQKSDKAGKIQYYELNKNNPKSKIISSLIKHIEDKHFEELIKKDMASDEVSTSTASNNNSSMFGSTRTHFEYEYMTTTDTNNLKTRKQQP